MTASRAAGRNSACRAQSPHTRWLSTIRRTRLSAAVPGEVPTARDRTDHQRPGGLGSRPACPDLVCTPIRRLMASAFSGTSSELDVKKKMVDTLRSKTRRFGTICSFTRRTGYHQEPLEAYAIVRSTSNAFCSARDRCSCRPHEMPAATPPRNAMILDFVRHGVGFLYDRGRALMPLETFIQQFGDIMTSDDVMDRMSGCNDTAGRRIRPTIRCVFVSPPA